MSRVNSLTESTLASHKTEVQQICKPLLDLIGVNHFSFTIYYKEGGLTRLSTSPEWSEHYFKEKYYNVIPTLNKNQSITHYTIWDYLHFDDNPAFAKVMQDARAFNIDKGFTINKHFKNFKVICSLASPKNDCQINDAYLNNINCIENFIYYFLNKAHPLIEKNRNNKIVLNDTSNNGGSAIKENVLTIINFHQSIILNNIYLKNVLLSKQETLCLTLMMLGKTSKKIAKIMNISSRTVDYYIENIKNKASCSDRSSLIEKAFECETLRGALLGQISVVNKKLIYVP